MNGERTQLLAATLDPAAGVLTLKWADGHQSAIPLPYLRSQCPCVSCRQYRQQGQGGPGLSILPPEIANASPIIDEIRPVGRYALQPIWRDGHSTGIYTFEYLRDLCPCDECRGRASDRS